MASATGHFSRQHTSAYRQVKAKGAAVTFTLPDAATYSPSTDTFGTSSQSQISGYAVRIPGNPRTYERLSLVQQESPTLLFIPDDYGAVPALDSSVMWSGRIWTVVDVNTISPDGVSIGQEIIVTGGAVAKFTGTGTAAFGAFALAAAGNVPFVPGDLTSATLVSWFDASRLSLANNASVTTLTDFSGNANDATQSTASQKALFKTAIQNGLPVVRYDGSNDNHLDPLALSGAKTILLVYKLRSTPGASTIWAAYSIKKDSTHFTDLYFSSLGGFNPYTLLDDFQAGTATVGITDALDTSAHVLLRTYNGGTNTSTGSYTVALDSVAKTIAVGASTSHLTTDLGAIGSLVAAGPSPSNASPMDLMERCVYNGVLSSQDQTTLIAYARTKWGI